MLPEKYDEEIKKDPSYPQVKEGTKLGTVELAVIANIKLQFLLKEVFAHRMKRLDAII